MLKLLILLFMPSQSFAANRLLAEGVPATNNTLWVATNTVRVGIGTTTPSYNLHVVGSQYASGQGIVGSSFTVIGNAFSVGLSSFVIVSGNAGIGTTSPDAKLHVTAGSNDLTQNVALIKGGGSSGAFGFEVQAGNGDSILKTNNLTYDVSMNSVGGKTGIGTSNPEAILDVRSAVSVVSSFTRTSAGDVPLLIYSDGAGAGITDNSVFNKGIYLREGLGNVVIMQGGGIEHVVVDNSGNVGINNTSPAGKLHVSSGAVIIAGTGGKLIFPDGTSQTSAITGHLIQISTDIAGTVLNGFQNFGLCVTTLTITFSGSPAYLAVETMGSISSGGGAGVSMGLSFLDNGVFPSGLGSGGTGKGILGVTTAAAGNSINAASRFVYQPSSGSHNICLTQRSSSNDVTYGGNSGAQGNSTFKFMVSEMK